MIRIMLFLCSFGLVGCLHWHDSLTIQSNGQLKWELNATLHSDLESLIPSSIPKKWISKDSIQLDHQMVFADSQAVHELDQSGESLPISQSIGWGRDSLSRLYFHRKLKLERDRPGEDGGYADRMQIGTYRGDLVSFQFKWPGQIEFVSPKPSFVDTMEGLVQWQIPLVDLTQRGVSFSVIGVPLPTNQAEIKEVRSLVLWIACVVFGLVLFLGWLFVRWNHGRKQ